MLVDSTGIKVLGDGEWQARKHGVPGWRQGRKIDLATKPALPDLLGQLPAGEQIGTVAADSAYHTRHCHAAIVERQVIAIIAIRRNGHPCKEHCPIARARNNTLRATRYDGRAFWKRWTPYHACSRIEAKMRCLKFFGEGNATTPLSTMRSLQDWMACCSTASRTRIAMT